MSTVKMSIHTHGYWQGLEASSQHVFDPSLAYALVEFFKKEQAQSIADFGCGMGDYVRIFLSHRLNAFGFDGNPNTPELTGQVGMVLDLSQPIVFGRPFEWVLSLEVGEHLPVEYENVFIENLHRNNTRGIVLSWAVEGQGGHGHFNERNNDYIKQKFFELGYVLDQDAENHLRTQSLLRWFKNTIMVFRRI